ncbi:MAG: hypothetical protein ACK4E7_08905 [Permianibacter sp.]
MTQYRLTLPHSISILALRRSICGNWQLIIVVSYDHVSISEHESRLLQIPQRAQVSAMAIGRPLTP